MVLKGNIIYTPKPEAYSIYENSYIVIENKRVVGVFQELPDNIDPGTVIDYGEGLIIPSFIDLHIHAPQFVQRGIGMHLQLIDWLEQYTFIQESLFEDRDHVQSIYPHFVDSLYNYGTLRSSIFATIHDESNRYLVELLIKKGLSAYVGKVNMNQNAPDSLSQTSELSLSETEGFIQAYNNESLVKPIITPRFAPSCTKELMDGLGQLSAKYHVPVQSHISENKDEIAWVKDLFPEANDYTDVYDQSGLIGVEKTLMAHGIYLKEDELSRLNNEKTFLVHCPISNMNIASGIMPVTRYLDMGLQVGLGSDVGGGHEMGMNKSIVAAIQCANILYAFNHENRRLLESEAVYLATKMNGKFFGDDVGSFEKGYLFDALIIHNKDPWLNRGTPLEKFQNFLYCGMPDHIVARYIEGKAI